MWLNKLKEKNIKQTIFKVLSSSICAVAMNAACAAVYIANLPGGEINGDTITVDGRRFDDGLVQINGEEYPNITTMNIREGTIGVRAYLSGIDRVVLPGNVHNEISLVFGDMNVIEQFVIENCDALDTLSCVYYLCYNSNENTKKQLANVLNSRDPNEVVQAIKDFLDNDDDELIEDVLWDNEFKMLKPEIRQICEMLLNADENGNGAETARG